MQEAVEKDKPEVEETLPESAKPPAPGPDPETQLKALLNDKDSWVGAAQEITVKLKEIKAHEESLNEKIAVNSFITLCDHLDDFAMLFVKEVVHKHFYDNIKTIFDKIVRHDSHFPGSLGSNRYKDILSKRDPSGYWLNLISKMSVDTTLSKFLSQVYGGKLNGSPFEENQK